MHNAEFGCQPTSTERIATKEVILAASAIYRQKLLMLSGIGEAKTLLSMEIDVVEKLPGVGENLQDHALVSGVVFKCTCLTHTTLDGEQGTDWRRLS